MKKNYTINMRLSLFFSCFFLLFGKVITAQVSAYSFVQTTEVYVPVTGTVSSAIGDDGTQTAIPIGFAFTLGSASYTSFSISTNGMIRLGGAAISAGWANNLNNSAVLRPLIAPLWDDNNRNTGSIQYVVAGVAPNRTLEVGWDNVNIGGVGATSATSTASFKIRLHETTNVIDMVYGGSLATAGTLSASIGLNDLTSFLSVTPAVAATASSAIPNNAISSVTNLAGKKYVFTPPPPCAGAPTAGTASAPAVACSGVNFALSLAGYTSGASGITFQWQSSPDGITYTNMAGATTANYTTSQTAATFYQCIVTCTASGTSSTSNFVNVAMNPFSVCYCRSGALNPEDEDIFNVTVGSLNNTSTCATTGGAGSLLNRYSNYYGVAAPSLAQTEMVHFSIQVGTCGGDFINGVAIFIDFNQNGSYADAGENVYNSAGLFTGPHTETGFITIPLTASLGITGMRVVCSEDFPIVPCGPYGFGETEDYNVNIVSAPLCTQPIGLSVSNVGIDSAIVSWSCPTCTGPYIIEYDTAGFTPGTGIIDTVASSPFNLTGLMQGTNYQISVSQDCSGTGDGTSTSYGPISFTTSYTYDSICGALPLSFGVNGPFETSVATIQVGEPVPPAGDCAAQTGWCNFSNTITNTLWFTFVAPASGRVSVQSPDFDTQLAIWDAVSCDTILQGGATLIAANDDDPNFDAHGGVMFSSFLSPVSCLTPGKTYYVQLDPFFSPGGSTRIVLTDIGVADASFATLNPTYCIFDTALTLAPVEAGGFFSGDGVTGFTFDPVTAGVGSHTIVYHLSSCDSTVQTVAVENVPVAAYTYSNVGNVVAFTNISSGSNANYWNFGDGSAPSTVANPVHTFTANRAYTVQLFVTNGCSFDTVSYTILITGIGIDELTVGSVSVFPNPTSGLFHVTVNNASFSELTMSVIDLQGKEVFSTMDKNITTGYNKEINLEGLSKGIYYLRLNTGTDMKVQKLIIQ